MVEELRSALSRWEVPMVEPEAVARIRGLRAAGWGAKRIAREMKVRRNTVRRYLKGGEGAEVQVRPLARLLARPAPNTAAADQRLQRCLRLKTQENVGI